MALVSTILIMVLMSALLIGFFAMIAADQQASGVNRDQTQAYAAAHAGLEKLTADLGALFTGGNYSPTAAQITALTATPPSLPGFQYLAADGTSGYTITPGRCRRRRFQNGPFQGLVGLITPYEINVTAKGDGRAGRRRRGAPAPAAPDGGRARVPVRHLLRERPQLLRRARASTSAAASTRTRTSTSRRTGRRR